LQVVDTSKDAINKLSRVAVLLDFVATEEHLHEPRPLTHSVELIQDNPEYGLYTILCRLHGIYAAAMSIERGIRIQDNPVETASYVTLTAASRSSHRHMRAYSILYDLTGLLHQLARCFDDVSRHL
jgi:hypothetical protein